MFEKEGKERCSIIDDLTKAVIRDVDSIESYKLGKLDGFKEDAEFGYNKANEWHYVKDGKMPKFDEGTEIKFLKGKYTKAKRIVICLCENNNYQNIYAWKEIVLPELKENE